MKRAVFLATAALLAMLILAPMAIGQGTTVLGGEGTLYGGPIGGPRGDVYSISASASPFAVPPGTGGADIFLPAAALLLGSGILTYAILRRR